MRGIMKGKIDRCGKFFIWRGGEYKKQFCPIAPPVNGVFSPCADWCPRFNEPWYDELDVHLTICNEITWTFARENFVDERPKEQP